MTTPAWRPWLIATVVGATAAALTILHGDVGWDATWILQVVSRIQHGDTLYLDVAAGVPPLVFYVSRAATSIFGLELVVLKGLAAVTVAVCWACVADLARWLTGTRRGDLPLALAMVTMAVPEPASLYQPLAGMWTLIAVVAVSRWTPRSSATDAARGMRLPLIAAGVAIGLSTLAKQTIGVYAALLVWAVMWIETRHARATRTIAPLATVAAAAAVTTALGLLPALISAGGANVLEYTVLGKGAYVRQGGVPLIDEVVAWFDFVRPGPAFDPVRASKSVALFVPIALLAAFPWLWRLRHRAPRESALSFALGLAGLAALVPRADVAHVLPAVPAMLVPLAVAWHAWAPRSRGRASRLAASALLIVVLGSLAIRGTAAAAAVGDDSRVFSDLPHLRGLLMRRSQADELKRDAERLRAVANPDGTLLLLVPNAGLYYLLSGARNPTPFDYPLMTTFGRHGEAALAGRIERGDFQRVCMETATGRLAPLLLQQAVTTHLTQTARLGPCTLYVRPTPGRDAPSGASR